MLSSLPCLLALLVLPALSVATGDVSSSEVVSLAAAALHQPTEIRHRSDEGALMLAGVRVVLDGQLSSSDRRRLGRKVLSESRVRLIDGTFPAGGTTLVTVNVPLRLTDPAAEPKFISGVFTLDDTGALAAIVVAPKMQAQRFDVEAIGDSDGDAMDEVVLAVAGAEVPERRMVSWADGAATDRVIGDGGE
jgi:hypothetical protein